MTVNVETDHQERKEKGNMENRTLTLQTLADALLVITEVGQTAAGVLGLVEA